ncbi:hypothetical protein B9Z55_028305 [Caenorhabditis nigoni]|uniref:CC domain-containing protein n=1 Tax=Caenorhabditis nigoni TaxID=1611254 RepID=A0A2G5SCL9_9PELO|nr:hypothetical protein B9Z55_028305 [Caenorhabditis nigoni]
MFKVLAVSAFIFVLAAEASSNLSCKTETTNAVAGVCPDGTTLLTGDKCCSSDNVFDVDAHGCSSEPLPAIDGLCPYGFILVADGGCCPNSDAVAKNKK